MNFRARPYGGADIQPGDVTSRTLRIGVQKGAVSPAQANIFQEMETYAQSKGIALEIVEIP